MINIRKALKAFGKQKKDKEGRSLKKKSMNRVFLRSAQSGCSTATKMKGTGGGK